eukprot:jgi/Tetstr1/464105/TSEL_008910.t1
MATAGGQVTIVQHINHLAARIQAVIHKVDSLSDQLEELKAGAGADKAGPTAEDVAALRDDIKRDVIKERAMMEASLEHRIDQQVNRLMIDRDQSAVISRLEKRMDDADATLVKLDARLAECAKTDGDS